MQAERSGRQEQEQVRFVEGAAGRLRVSDGGAATDLPPLVLHHGLGSNLEVWRSLLNHLRPKRRVVAYDARGHGGSDPARDGVYTLSALADDLDRVVVALGIERFILVGHSMAGGVLSAYAAAHPEKLIALVYADAVGDLTQMKSPGREEFLAVGTAPGFGPDDMRAAFSQMLGPNARPSTREQVLASAAATAVPAFVGLRRSLVETDPRPSLERFHGPRLSIEVGAQDGPWRPSSALGAKKRTLTGVSHWFMLDDPEALNRIIDEFLAEEASVSTSRLPR